MSDLLLAFVDRHPAGVTPLAVATDVLALRGPDSLLSRMAERVLTATEGLERQRDGRWRRRAAATVGLAAVEVKATGRVPGLDVLVALGAAAEVTGTSERFRTLVRPTRPLRPDELARLGLTMPALERAPSVHSVQARTVAICGGRQLLVWRGGRTEAWLRAWTGQPTLSLRSVLKAQGLPAGSPADAAAGLGLPAPVKPDVGAVARSLLAIGRELRARAIPLVAPEPLPGFDFDSVRFDASVLAALPERPGVYRFVDRAGGLLYVGKARNLRARVSSYFVHREQRRARYTTLMERLWDLEWEETGSELKALLRELELLRCDRPELNVQREVQRRRELRGTCALFLPGAAEGRVDILVLHHGHVVGTATSDRKATGMRAVRALLRRTLRGAAIARTDQAEAQIVASWLRDTSDRTTLVDLSTVRSRDAAAALVKATLKDPELFRESMTRRG